MVRLGRLLGRLCSWRDAGADKNMFKSSSQPRGLGLHRGILEWWSLQYWPGMSTYVGLGQGSNDQNTRTKLFNTPLVQVNLILDLRCVYESSWNLNLYMCIIAQCKCFFLSFISGSLLAPSYTNANLWFFEAIFFKNAHWFYIIFSRPAGATNQFWTSFERSKSRYCCRVLIFKEMLNKICLNLSFKLGTFSKFLLVLCTCNKNEKMWIIPALGR